MVITFLGTRGFIKSRTKRHYRHTSTLIEHRGKRIMVDCGLDWQDLVFKLNPDAIVITHAHPDHAFGLQQGSPCNVYATQESWRIMKNFKIKPEQKHLMVARESVDIAGITFETFPVIHSIRAPGVGYRITAGKRTIFCVHDLIAIEERHEALRDVSLYIGDGASITRPLVRQKEGKLFGHTPISTQLGWCQKEGVPRMIVTHCGSQIVEHDGRTIAARVRALAKARGVEVKIAFDGMQIEL